MDSGDVKALADPVGHGLQFGLLIGKQVGITAASWIVIRFGLAEMPSGVNWGQIHSSAILASVGFTMSLFVSDLAFPHETTHRVIKVDILAGSALCAAVSYYVLRSALELDSAAKQARNGKHPGRNYIGPPSVCILEKRGVTA